MSSTTETVTVQLGRPVNMESNRQKRLAEIAERRAAGLVKRGRPAVEGSKNQLVKAARNFKIQSGIELKRGRPVSGDSRRQQRLAELAERKASGTFKLGRPKMVVESIIEVAVPTKAKSNKKVVAE
jgi:hypothetical protein